MDRASKILSGVDKGMLGIEVAPWISPLVPKSAGYNVRIIDVFDRETLASRAQVGSAFLGKDTRLIEHVDFVGSATEIETLIPENLHGTFDYIASSHNFEHLPNPIKFLQGCQKVLRPGGLLTMAVPDRRACFDYFGRNTALGDWLDAHMSDSDCPTPRQKFDNQTRFALLTQFGTEVGAFEVGVPLTAVNLQSDLIEAFTKYYNQAPADGYEDAHCTVMTPASLELLLIEVRQLGFISFDIEEISEPQGCEFYVRIRFISNKAALSAAHFLNERTRLSQRVIEEYVRQAGILSPKARLRYYVRKIARSVRNFGRRVRNKPAR